MTFDKEKIIYLGAGVLLLLIIINSSKSLPLKEIEENESKNFDSSRLPFGLKPPIRLGETEPLPETKAPKRNFNLSFQPRFDK